MSFSEGQRVVVKVNAVDKDRNFSGRTGIFQRYTQPHGYAKVRMERYHRQDKQHGITQDERRQEVLATYVFHPESLEVV